MMYRKLPIYILLLLLSFSCQEDYDYHEERVLVVEGWIDSGDYPVVMVTTSASVSGKEQPFDSLNEYLLKWAKVTVSNGEEEIILTGKIDTCYTPPYIFTTGKMKGESGKTYRLTVSYNDFYAESETTIPYQVPLDSLTVSQVEGDTLFQLKAYFNDNKLENNYYKFFVRVKGKEDVMRPSFLGTINDEVLGEQAEVQVYQPLRMFNEEYTPFYRKDDRVSVKFSQMNEEAYNFWKVYDELQSFSGVLFFPVTSSLPSNIKGGIGYWFGYGSTTYHLNINSKGYSYVDKQN